MAMRLWLNRAARRRIQKLDRRARDGDVRVRCRVLLKVASGQSCNAAARAVGCVPSTAVRIVARYRVEGEAALIDHRCDNGTRKVDDDAREGLRQILVGRPQDHGFPRPTWTLELLRRVVAEGLGIVLSVGYLWKLVRGLGARWGRPRAVVACPWKAAKRRRRIAFLRRLAATVSAGEVVLFADEVDLHLNPKIGPDWMLPRIQRLVVTPGNNEKRHLAGAYDPVAQRLVYVEGNRKHSGLFVNLLRALLEAYRGVRRIHVILDNFIIHKSRVTCAWLAVQGARIRLHFTPPYCPEANRIERLWLDLHANVTRNHRARTIGELLANVHRYLADRFHTERRVLLAA